MIIIDKITKDRIEIKMGPTPQFRLNINYAKINDNDWIELSIALPYIVKVNHDRAYVILKDDIVKCAEGCDSSLWQFDGSPESELPLPTAYHNIFEGMSVKEIFDTALK